MMKKSYLLAVTLILTTSGIVSSQAADFAGGEIGYGYNSVGDGVHAVHLDVQLLDKFVVGLEARKWNNRGEETDVYAKYKVGPFAIGAGRAGYYDRGGALFGLAEVDTHLIGPVDAYANLKLSKEEVAYKLGLQYDLNHNGLEVDLNYTYVDRDNLPNEDGLGIGLNYHF